jgi:hypothetical protein
MICKNALLVSSKPTVWVYWTIPWARGVFDQEISKSLFWSAGCIGRETFPTETLIASTSSVLFVNCICAILIAEGCLAEKYVERCGIEKRIKN